ncbi:MAG TPA: SRPBCC domain-containing protein, partial [Chitinophagaceae bacterium]|nr:SRPBCC domain-containing protein [Chitinophagaceae bacterium]
MAADTVLSPGRQLTISRVVNAPRELVWKVWTDPEHIKNWWGPNGFTNTIFQMDVKPGGVWDFIMHGPDGTDYKNKSVYKEIVKYAKIVYDHLSGPKFRSTVTFTEQGNKTLINIEMLFETAEERDNVVKVFKADVGLRQNIYKLEGYLRKVSSEREMTLERVINAPRALVFAAWTDPRQLEKWWGPKGFTNPVCDVDVRPGGKILIHMRAEDGAVYPMDGEFHEIVEPKKLVFTSAALDKNGKRLFEVLNTVNFTEENGKTKLKIHAAVSKITDEGKPFIEGMNEGWNQTIDRLDDYAQGRSHNKGNTMDSSVVIERTFNATVEAVWKAITDIEQMKQWYFPQLTEFKPQEGFETEFTVHHEGRDFLH